VAPIGALVLVWLLLLWFSLAAIAPVPVVPRPGTGASSVEELIVAYRHAHASRSLTGLRDLEVSEAYRQSWFGPLSGLRGALRQLFTLELEDVRFVPLAGGPRPDCLTYVTRGPTGQQRSDSRGMTRLHGKLLLLGRRSDGV